MEEYSGYQAHLDNAINWMWDFIPDLIVAIIILVLGLWVIRIINRIVHRYFKRKDFDLALESFLQSFISIALKIVLFVLVITQLGVKSSSLVAIVGAAGLAIGLALQGSLANFAGGVLILIFKPFRVGDFIEAQGQAGTVKEITIFTTKLNTFGNQVAILPNGKLSNDNIVNYSTESTRRDKITIGIGYGSNLRQAKDILLRICDETETILQVPIPEVYVEELADSSVNLQLRFWTTNENFWTAHFKVIEEAKIQFDKAGIEIPFPQRDIHIQKDQPLA